MAVTVLAKVEVSVDRWLALRENNDLGFVALVLGCGCALEIADPVEFVVVTGGWRGGQIVYGITEIAACFGGQSGNITTPTSNMVI